MIASWLTRAEDVIEISRFWLVLNSSVCVILALSKQGFSLICVGTSIWLSEDRNWLRRAGSIPGPGTWSMMH